MPIFPPTSIAAVDLSHTGFTSASSGSQLLVRLPRGNPAPIRLAGDGYAVGLVRGRAIRRQGCRRADPAGDRGQGARLPGRRRGRPRHRRGRSHRGRLARHLRHQERSWHSHGYWLRLLAPAVIIVTNQLGTIAPLVGRDAQLTGRVDLWLILPSYIAERPWLGRCRRLAKDYEN